MSKGPRDPIRRITMIVHRRLRRARLVVPHIITRAIVEVVLELISEQTRPTVLGLVNHVRTNARRDRSGRAVAVARAWRYWKYLHQRSVLTRQDIMWLYEAQAVLDMAGRRDLMICLQRVIDRHADTFEGENPPMPFPDDLTNLGGILGAHDVDGGS